MKANPTAETGWIIHILGDSNRAPDEKADATKVRPAIARVRAEGTRASPLLLTPLGLADARLAVHLTDA